MAFIRRVRTASGATAVQIAQYVGGRRQEILAHVGSAHTDAELGVLLERARELLADDGQGEFDLGLESQVVPERLVPAPGGPALLQAPASLEPGGLAGPARVTGTASRVLFDALTCVFTGLGFEDVLGDPVFQDLVIARVVEPTSLLDTGRVLTDLGCRPASYHGSCKVDLSFRDGGECSLRVSVGGA